ncbi:ABC transporter substrate-binding protein [Cellulomonas denverensis]|uniref:ABC transporter substrate-binding protein n=1 Tax=Cellulomonas denverensis TaxID=264297 RepID=UPI0035EF9390
MPDMHRRRNTRRGIALAAGLALGLAACAGQGSGGNDTGAAGDDGPTTLTLWHGMTGPDGPAVQQIIDDFNASQDQIVVEPNVMPWDVLYQKVLTSLSSNSGPQVVAMSASNVPQYASKGALAPVDDFYADDAFMDTSVLPDAAKNAAVFDGTNYGVPLNIAPMMLYWNKDLFSAAGLDPEQPPTTWDEFASMAEKLTIDDNGDGKPEQYALALADHTTVPIWQMLLWGTGGGVVSDDATTAIVDSPETLEALEFWVEQVRDKQVSPIGLSGADADKLFQTGKAAMEIVGPWMTTGFDDAGLNYGLAAPPDGPEAQVTLGDVVTFTVNAKATDAEQEAAKTFFAYWNSVESQTTWADGSGFPPTRTDIPASDLSNPYSAVFGDPELLGSAQVYLAGVPNSGTITDSIFYPALQRVLNGDGDLTEVFTQANTDIQAQIDQG